jgi:hypothetical protein
MRGSGEQGRVRTGGGVGAAEDTVEIEKKRWRVDGEERDEATRAIRGATGVGRREERDIWGHEGWKRVGSTESSREKERDFERGRGVGRV